MNNNNVNMHSRIINSYPSLPPSLFSVFSILFCDPLDLASPIWFETHWNQVGSAEQQLNCNCNATEDIPEFIKIQKLNREGGVQPLTHP